ncbi:helix-turn-helix domain-containing protein [Peptoanaerobacter stomatis]|jgi:transcriptional regulator, araC family
MNYGYEKFLTSVGFTLDEKCNLFSPIGVTYKINAQEMDGYYWFYTNDYFSVNIHDFNVKKDIIVNHTQDDLSDTYVSISYIKSVHGECLTPYQSVTDNMTFTYFHKKGVFRFLLHGGYPYFSVGIEYKEKFIAEFVEKTSNLDKEVLEDAFQQLNSLEEIPEIQKIADDILSYDKNFPASEIYYEVKAKELLNIAINRYFERKESKAKISLQDDISLDNVCKYINDHYSSDISQDLLCKIALMSKTKLKDSFKRKYNMSITEYIQRRRINVAEHMLIATNLNISEVARAVGYNSHSRFSTLFKKYKGNLPQEAKKFSFY